MANFDQLKQSVAALIRTNGAEEITGQIMQDVLLTIINSISGGYMFGGVAQHSGNVGNPDYNVFYLAGSGAYTGYGGAITIEAGCYGVFRYNGVWTQEVVDIGVRLSGSIAEGETRGVTGDVINTALQTLFENVMNILDTLTFSYNTPSAQQATKAMIDVIMTPTGGASHVFGTLTLASATVAAAGLMSAEDKQKVDRMLTDFRSLSFSDTTAAADQATKIVQTLSATLGENPEAITTMTFLAATASKAGLMSAADKAVLDCMVAMLGYYECSTAAGTAAKVVSASGYSLKSGGCIRIKMNNANTANNVTLNINSTGAKALYYEGVQASPTNTWEAGEVLEVYYDGTQYQCASGGGGKFASGEKVKDTSITNEVAAGSAALPTSGAVYDNTPSNMDSGTNTDLDVVDEQNNILLRLAGGGIKTKNFDSDIDAPLRSGDSGYDLEISDEQNNILLRLADGGIKTKNFDSSVDAPLRSGDSDYDLEISDEQNNVLLRLAGGGIKTKNFDSDNIELSDYAKKKVIKYLAVGNSVNQDAACYIPYLLRKLYGDDIDFEIGIAYRAGYTIKDYVQRIITGLDNLHIFSHAKNSMVLINENNKSFDYAINFSDWDIVSFQMYQAPDKTEDVSYAPMLLDYLKHNTKNGCKFGLVTPATYAGSTYRNAYIGFQQDILTSCALDFMLDYGATKEFFIINGMTVDTSTDNVHTDDGFGCEALALTAVHLLSDIYGLDDRASNIDTPVTQEENTAINVAGSNGSFQTTTDDNWRKCVDAALQGWRTGCASYSLANNTLRLRTFNT